jgi:addiction module RelE/StbE family toxin
MQVSFTALALSDIENIRAYIAKDNPEAASRMAVAIVAAADRLSDNPRLGRIGSLPGTFELIVKPHVIVYEITRTEITVLRVWHGRQKRPGT